MIVDKEGLNIRSRRVSINVLGPEYAQKWHEIRITLQLGGRYGYKTTTNNEGILSC